MRSRLSGGLSSREHLPGKGPDSPAHAHRPAVLRTFNMHNKCTGICRFVRGIPVGIRHRVAALRGFFGLAEASGWPGDLGGPRRVARNHWSGGRRLVLRLLAAFTTGRR
jgi:hypothetical protein